MSSLELRSGLALNTFSHTAMKLARRIAVMGMVCLFILAANGSLFAAQCGGLPKGWHAATDSADRVEFSLSDVRLPSSPSAPRPAPCRCIGSSCSPAVPSPAPDQRVTTGSVSDGILVQTASLGRSPSPVEFPNAVTASLRFEVVLGVFRPPCGV